MKKNRNTNHFKNVLNMFKHCDRKYHPPMPRPTIFVDKKKKANKNACRKPIN